MTPEEKQKHEANSPAALQAQQIQAQNQSQLKQFQQQETLENQKQLGKATAEVTRQAISHGLASLETEGTPGNTGFGDVTAL